LALLASQVPPIAAQERRPNRPFTAPIARSTADFTFVVPVRLVDMHPTVVGGFVNCVIYSVPASQLQDGDLGYPIPSAGASGYLTEAKKDFDVDTTTGDFYSDIVVEVSGGNLVTAQSYACGLGLLTVGPNGRTSGPPGPGREPAVRPKPGTSFVAVVKGSL
jgi:hypothetical protein